MTDSDVAAELTEEQAVLQGVSLGVHERLERASSRLEAGLTMQKYLFGYSAAISCVSPALTGYQLCKVYSRPTSVTSLARIGLGILPHQTALKALQMNAATPIKEHVSPWVAFGVVGVLQGGVYGQCNVTFSRALRLSQHVSLAGMFRGSAFAGLRDTISQGAPFMLSSHVQAGLVDPLLAPRRATAGVEDEADEDGRGSAVRRAIAERAQGRGAGGGETRGAGWGKA